MRKQILFRNISALQRNKSFLTTNYKVRSFIHDKLLFMKIYSRLILKNYLNVIANAKMPFITTTQPLINESMTINFIKTTNLGDKTDVGPKKAS